MLKCRENKNSCDIKIYFHLVKITPYSIKYKLITSPFFFMISKYIYLFVHDWKYTSCIQTKFAFSKKHFYHIYYFFIQVKCIFVIWILRLIIFLSACRVFRLYLKKAVFYFQSVYWTAARGFEKAAKNGIIILSYES